MDSTRRKAALTLPGLVLVTPHGALAQTRGAAPAPAAAQPDVETARKELPVALNALFRFEVARRGARVGAEGLRAADSFLQKGVDTLANRNELINVLAVSAAIDGARRLGNEVVTEAARLGQNLKDIGASAVAAA